jgi:hypothetical protein
MGQALAGFGDSLEVDDNNLLLEETKSATPLIKILGNFEEQSSVRQAFLRLIGGAPQAKKNKGWWKTIGKGIGRGVGGGIRAVSDVAGSIATGLGGFKI